jgi:hypothetical protein
MKKLIIATAAILAVTLASGSAFAIPGDAAKTLEAPAATVKVSCRCHRPRNHCRPPCSGYYSLYTYVVPCYGGCGCGGCGHGGYTWTCGGFFGGVFGW